MIYSAKIAPEPVPCEILPDMYVMAGTLAELEIVGASLIRVKLSGGKESLVDKSLFPTLLPLLGKQATIGHFYGKWQAGVRTV